MNEILEYPRLKGETKDRKFVEALARGLDVLRAFGQKGGVLGNQDIAAITGLPKPTISRLTYTLTQLGYLTYSTRLEKYQLEAGVLALGNTYTASLRVRQVAKPYMDELAKRVEASVGLATREGMSMIFVEWCRGDQAQALRYEVGTRVAMATSASGRAFLAAIPEQERSVFSGLIEERAGDDWPKISAGIDQAVTDYQEKGYVVSFGDWDRNVNSVAVPVRLQEDRIVVLTSGGPSYLTSPEQLENTIAPQLIHMARDIVAAGV
jgi:DNA-binding IclR family transcriptional regulator